jgi:signal transduction histidine kinase
LILMHYRSNLILMISINPALSYKLLFLNLNSQEGAKIYISDTGCGMPKDEISKITEAFYRIDKSRSRKQGGVGLGLAICKEIVRIHQGEMRFISQQGKGTTVIITIRGGAYEKTN